MARCSYHPAVETELTCTECGRPICPREMVLTPVGYKCPEHARPAKAQYTYVKPKQMALGGMAALATGCVGAAALVFIGFGGVLGGILWGFLVAEAVRRASGGHRGTVVAAIGTAGVAAGWLLTMPFGGLWPLTPIAAAVVVVVQLGAYGSR